MYPGFWSTSIAMLGISRVILLTYHQMAAPRGFESHWLQNQFDSSPGPPPVGLCARMRAVHGCVELWDSMITPFPTTGLRLVARLSRSTTSASHFE